jgi:two pore calcium channel protein 3
MGTIERFKIVIKTIFNIGPSILTYGIVIFVFFYIYAIIGMEFFQDKIHEGNVTNVTTSQTKFCGKENFCCNDKLKDSDFAKDGYCKVNFNNIMMAFMSLFTLMVVNNWHVLTDGFVRVTSKWARLYFFSFHLVVVILVLNIFTAFILEVFILEYTLHKGRYEFAIEKKIHELGLGLDQKKTSEKMNQSKSEKTKEQTDELHYETFEEVSMDANAITKEQVKKNKEETLG